MSQPHNPQRAFPPAFEPEGRGGRGAGHPSRGRGAGPWCRASLADLTLQVLEERAGFMRVHKQHLVNVDRVVEILPGDEEGSSVRTRSGQTVPVSRRFLPLLKQRLGV